MVGRIKRDNLQRANCWLGRKKPHLLTLYCTVSTELTCDFTTYPLVDEAPGQQALHFEKQVLTNRTVIAPPVRAARSLKKLAAVLWGGTGAGVRPSSSLWAPAPGSSGVMGLGPWGCVLLGPCHDHRSPLSGWFGWQWCCCVNCIHRIRVALWAHGWLLDLSRADYVSGLAGIHCAFTELVVWTEIKYECT